MATAIPLEPATIEALDAVVASGRFSSRDEAIRTALHIVEEVDAADDETLDARTIALLEQRIAEAGAEGSVWYSVDEVFDELERRCLDDMDDRGIAAARKSSSWSLRGLIWKASDAG